MPRFHYRALRPSGGEIAGELVADSERDAAARLQAGGSYPIEISAETARPRFAALVAAARAGRLPAGELILFTRQLAALLGAGVALDRALSLAAGSRGGMRRTRLAVELLAAVNRGESLSRACRDYPALPPHYAMVIAAGEAKGDIGGALDRLAAVLERSRAASRALLGALIYPLSVFVVAGISIGFLLTFVVPRFETLLAGFRHEPPLAMRVLLIASAVFQEAALPGLVVLIAAGGFIAFRWRDRRFRAALDRRLLRLPLIGPLLGKVEAERLAFLLGNLVAAGVALPAAVAATGRAMTHETYRAGLAAAERAIERGDGVTPALTAGGLLPDLACELVRIGEVTGDLAPMLLKAGDILQREVEATGAELIGLVTPVSIVVLGLLVGGIAFALLGTVMEVYDVAL